LFSSPLFAQTGVIGGKVFDEVNGESLPFANVIVVGSSVGVSTDLEGLFELKGLQPGLYTLSFTFVGYDEVRVPEVRVTNNTPAYLNVGMKANSTTIGEAVVKPSVFTRSNDSPVSLRTLGISEIERSPGANRDISKVIGSLPGVAQGVAFRNDLIIRGGGPSENRFYIEDIETPNINHFATQGASGGPVGMIDVNYVREVDFFSGAFQANTGNALSSVLRVKYKSPRNDRTGFRLTLGASDFGLGAEGPIGSQGNFIVSARRSYLQLLFAALELPFLPTYNDLQYKVNWKLSNGDEVYTIFLGAFDVNALNLDANETEQQRYILSYLPEQDQWNYTNGYVYKRFVDNGYDLFVFSRNVLNNVQTKYQDNIESEENTILKYRSTESENKGRYENIRQWGEYRVSTGVGYEYAAYEIENSNTISTPTGPLEINFQSRLFLNKYSAWTQINRSLLSDRLRLSAGLRVDGTDYSSKMSNPFTQLSPRISASFSANEKISLNANAGRYFQLPSYTTLGYRDEVGTLANQSELRYVQADHLVAGVAYDSEFESRISVEGFYKKYQDYPFDLRDSVSLANFGGEFGTVGNIPVSSGSEGRAFGVEVMYQQKMFKGFYGVLAYTWVRSEFGLADELLPSNWDSRHLVSLTAGKKLPGDWEIGLKWRYSGGLPYTPIDVESSALIANYTVNPLGIRDYDQLNSQRLSAFHGLDFRVDKKFYWERSNMTAYFDVQNAYGFQASQAPLLIAETDEAGSYVVDPNNPNAYLTKLVDNPTGTLLPSIGIILEF
jgi:hypothetical protein